MFTKEEPINLTNLAGGAAEEMFRDEWQKILDNIVDPNTQPKTPRELVLKVRITPDEDRQIGDIMITCTSKTSPVRSFVTRCVFGKIGKRGEARELQNRQETFLDRGGNVVPIKQGEGGKDA
jgi:hypothetical protein